MHSRNQSIAFSIIALIIHEAQLFLEWVPLKNTARCAYTEQASCLATRAVNMYVVGMDPRVRLRVAGYSVAVQSNVDHADIEVAIRDLVDPWRLIVAVFEQPERCHTG